MFQDVISEESSKVKPQRRAKSKKLSGSEYTESLQLPSGFKPYSFNELLVRPLKIKEVKAIQPILNNSVSGITLATALQDVASVRLDQLTYGDFWYVLAWLRINTFENAPFMIKWPCPKCNQANKKALVLSELDIVELPEEYKEPARITLPNSEVLSLRLQRVEDQTIVENYVKTVFNKDSATEEDLYVPSIAITIANGKSLHDNIQMISESEKYTAEDLQILADFQNVFGHGMPRYISDKCGGTDGCGFSVERIRLYFRVYDTIPSNQYRGYIRNNIQFG